jgi:LacI family transcriptional regulator
LNFPARDRLPLCPGEPSDAATFTQWFRRHRPDALLVPHAQKMIEWLRAIGAHVPRDVGVVELQDRPDSGTSGVYYDPGKIGALAVEMLVGLMHRNETGVPDDQHEVMLTGEWREGTTLPRR